MRAAGKASKRQMMSTAAVPEAERFHFWRDIVWDVFVPVSLKSAPMGPFHGEVEMMPLGPLTIARLHTDAQVVTRTPAQVSRQGPGITFVNVPFAPGSYARQDGRTARLGAGEFTAVDSGRPFEIGYAERFEQLSLLVPNELLLPRLADPGAATARVAGSAGLGTLFTGVLRGAAQMRTAPEPRAAAAAAEHLIGLLILALGEPVGPVSSSAAVLTQAVLDEIDRGLHDPELTPARVAARAGISVRYLHKLLAGRGGPSFGALVQERRLEGSRRQLLDPSRLDTTILQVAFDHGFDDPSYFSRVFKRRYGISPREMRGGVDRRGGGDRRSDPRG